MAEWLCEVKMMKNRVVVTGMGVISPIGINVEDYWNNLKKGVSGIDSISSIDTSKYNVHVAGEVKDFNVENYMDKREARKLDRFSQFAVVAAKESLADSKINIEEEDPFKVGVIVGSGIGGFITLGNEFKKNEGRESLRVSPFFIPMIISNMASGHIAINIGAKGPCYSVTTACATGTNAIGEAYRYIKEGKCDVMLCGGTEAPITPIAVAGFSALKALSTNTDATRASIPFDKERGGFVMGEGAGVLVIESLEHAIKRNADIYAEIVGYGTTCDAYHITAPDPEGLAAIKAMEEALKDAEIGYTNINYINAHGTGTYYNDKIETLAIKEVFKEKAYNIPISSTKSMTGHLLGAAGAVEAIACVKTLQDNYIHPTIGLKVKDEECDLDYVPNEGRASEVNYALSNSLGFGGHNAVLIFKKL